jgi:hypothetical protein
MKKILLFAAAAAMVFTSCMQGTVSEVPAGQTSIVVKIANVQNAETRNVEGTGSANVVAALTTDSRIYVYVLRADGTKEHGEALTNAEATTGKTLKDGAFFSDESEVFVLANIPADITDAELAAAANLTDIKALSSAITYDNSVAVSKDNIEYLTPPMANVDGVPATLGAATGGVATAAVRIAPVIARIELVQITGGQSIVAGAGSFQVGGGSLANSYADYTMGGSYPAGATYNDNGNVKFDTTPAGWFCDVPATALACSALKKVVPATGKVWAYHAAGNASAPIFIVKISGETAYYPMLTEDPVTYDTLNPTSINEDRYLSISSYTSSDADWTGEFKAGRIYKIADLPYNFNQLAETPNPDAVTIQVTVTVDQWVVVNLTPVIGQ